MNNRLLAPALCWLCLTVCVSVRADPTATLTAQADVVQAAGLPVIVHLTVRNTGLLWFGYTSGCCVSDAYPSARYFSATLTSASGQTYKASSILMFGWHLGSTALYVEHDTVGNTVMLYNGQTIMGSQPRYVPINSGDSVDVPLALSAVPLGRYKMIFHSGMDSHLLHGKRVVDWPEMTAAPITISVQDDPALAQSEAEALLRRARAGDPFAASLRAHFDVPVSDNGNGQ